MQLQAITVHTESMHNEHVWARLCPVLALLRHRRAQATLFVYPFRAVVAGKEAQARRRVAQLVRLGYEIGQHTHFYAGDRVDKPYKTTDLSLENVRYCVTRDFQWLADIVAPRGFVAGGWAVPEGLYAVLIDLGFSYDCSARHPELCRRPESPRLWLANPRFYVDGRGRRILLLPTTHTLRDSTKPWDRRWAVSSERFRYRLIYFHDYDLLRPHAFLAVLFILLRPVRYKSAAAIARWCREMADAGV